MPDRSRVAHESKPISLLFFQAERKRERGEISVAMFALRTGRLPPLASGARSRSDYCLDLVRKRDHEGFLCSLLLPHRVRQSALAIRAFNAEISAVRDSVSDRTIGQMRMQFWRDVVEEMYAVPAVASKSQPVVAGLQRAVREHRLSKELLLRMISARDTLLAEKPFPNIDAAEEYGKDAFSSANYLVLECLKKANDESISGHARHAANQLGKAQGLATMLRGVPHNASKRRAVFLPTDVMMTHGVSAESVVRGKDSEGLRHCVEVVASRAQEHLEGCRFRQKYLSTEERLVMLPAVAVDAFLSRLHRAKCDVFDSSLQSRDSMLPLTLYWRKWRRTY
jgi:NADH dehydrogenase [ubiquinone] 1 alpha subcomplex assembly factor 6